MYDFIETAQRMVATPSVTTEGTVEIVDYLVKTVVPHLPGEASVCPAAGGRDANLLFRVAGRTDQAPLLLNSHLDTVPPGQSRSWTSTGGNPFRSRVEGDRLIGLGSADAKLDWLCKAEALRRCAGVTLRRPVLLLGTYGEERGLVGAREFLEQSSGPRPAAALVGEPTECQLVTQHKGLLVGELHLAAETRELSQVLLGSRKRRYAGRSAHSATPDRGDSAIVKALAALADETPVVAIRGGDAANKVAAWCEVELAVSRGSSGARGGTAETPSVHPMSPALLAATRDFSDMLRRLTASAATENAAFSPPRLTTNIGLIDGRGTDLAVTFDVRTLPGDDGAAMRTRIEGLARKLEERYAGVRVRLVIERDNRALAPAPPGLVDRALAVMESVGLPRTVAAKAGCTEAGLYAGAGIPAVVFGAGQAAGNIHAPNEWTSIAQLYRAVDFYAAFIEAFCVGG
jgi:succinyl-diaminopimelate desuccinylase